MLNYRSSQRIHESYNVNRNLKHNGEIPRLENALRERFRYITQDETYKQGTCHVVHSDADNRYSPHNAVQGTGVLHLSERGYDAEILQ